jgi:polyhydroxyalkanoate synthase
MDQRRSAVKKQENTAVPGAKRAHGHTQASGASAKPRRRPTDGTAAEHATAQAAEQSSAQAETSAGANAGTSQQTAQAADPHPDPHMRAVENWWAAWGQMPFASASVPRVAISPDKLMELQRTYAQRLTQLWGDFLQHPEKTTEPIKDSRFADPAWQQSSLASFYARAYLLNSEFMNHLAESVEADRKTKRRVKFAVSQWVDAASPSNYLALNPKAQKTLLETRGESLTAGLQNLLQDITKGKISQSDETAFEVGHNVATSEGVVVYENRLMQLIQYKPLTEKVHQRPFVIVPPCINKFYILDLQPENSFVRNCVEQGHTVFLISWKNPHEPEAKMTWDDYLELGPIAALNVTREITGEKQVNALGFCVGGTLICGALAVMYARGDDPITSLTLLTALLDFEDTGVLDIFIDENHVRMREKSLGKGGLMPGRDLANTFSSLRANDLVWNYVVSNYLEGKSPPAFDLLYWNGDATNLPGPMYCWYLRNCYLENNLRMPNKLTSCGQRLDLTRIKVPTYVFAAREDHIVPWKAAYASARLLPGRNPGDVRFVLGASGHIAGTVNPAKKNKRSYWTGGDNTLPADSETWFIDSTEHPGSWWNDWNKWLTQFGGGEIPARTQYGSDKHPPIEPAPGRYVKEKA